MINSSYYAGKLRGLRQEKARNGQGKLTHGTLFLQDNSPAHLVVHSIEEIKAS